MRLGRASDAMIQVTQSEGVDLEGKLADFDDVFRAPSRTGVGNRCWWPLGSWSVISSVMLGDLVSHANNVILSREVASVLARSGP